MSEEKRRRGREPHEPTALSRGSVEMMAAAGVTSEQIAAVIGISGKTLRKHYRDELDRAVPKLILAAVGKLYNVMTRSKNERNSLIASMFVLKTRGRWSETGGDDPQDRPLSDMVREDVAKLMSSAPPIEGEG